MVDKKMNILVGGAGGFIAGYLVKSLVRQGHSVIAADIKPKDQWYQVDENANNHYDCDLGLRENCYELSAGADRVYNLACNMGGMGFIQNNHALCMESVLIQTHMLQAARDRGVSEILYSSSACIYPQEIQSEIKHIFSTVSRNAQRNQTHFQHREPKYRTKSRTFPAPQAKLRSEIKQIANISRSCA